MPVTCNEIETIIIYYYSHTLLLITRVELKLHWSCRHVCMECRRFDIQSLYNVGLIIKTDHRKHTEVLDLRDTLPSTDSTGRGK